MGNQFENACQSGGHQTAHHSVLPAHICSTIAINPELFVFTQHLDSSALCVLSLQPIFVENDGQKMLFCSSKIIYEVLLLTYV